MNKLIICIPLLIALINCNKNNQTDDIVSKYQSCCGIEPVEFVQDSYYIYIPNCFSPDGDAINDFFIPSVSDNIIKIKSYEIYSSENNSNELIFSSNDFNIGDFAGNTWIGRDKNNNKLRGKFKFKIKFETIDRQEIFVQGACCVLYCFEDGAILKDKKSCFFGNQGYKGRLESTIPIFEIDCFQ